MCSQVVFAVEVFAEFDKCNSMIALWVLWLVRVCSFGVDFDFDLSVFVYQRLSLVNFVSSLFSLISLINTDLKKSKEVVWTDVGKSCCRSRLLSHTSLPNPHYHCPHFLSFVYHCAIHHHYYYHHQHHQLLSSYSSCVCSTLSNAKYQLKSKSISQSRRLAS